MSWGEPDRADLTFSVAKTYLALLAGIAFDRGLLPDVETPSAGASAASASKTGRNTQVTWAQLLQQTSEWEGTSSGSPTRRTAIVSSRFRPPPPQAGKATAAAPAPRNLLGVQRRAH